MEAPATGGGFSLRGAGGLPPLELALRAATPRLKGGTPPLRNPVDICGKDERVSG